MNPIHLDTLLSIIDEGSFEGASLALSISPSAVSQRVKALEHHVGRVLVSRTQPAKATEAGEVLVQAARKMVLLQAETKAQLSGRLAEIPLTIAINADSLSTWFPPVFNEVASWCVCMSLLPNACLISAGVKYGITYIWISFISTGLNMS